MLYPKIHDIRKSNKIIRILMLLSILCVVVCKTINVLTYKEFDWAFIVMIAMAYTWVTVIYAIRKHTNIAAHVLLQVMLLIVFVYLLDRNIGYMGWSVNLALPIILISANTIMFFLTVLDRKKYMRYAFCHLIIFILSILPLVLYYAGYADNFIFMVISTAVAVITFITTSCLCGRELLEAAERTLHM